MTTQLDKFTLRHLIDLLYPLTGLADNDGLPDLLDAIAWNGQQLGLTDPTVFSALLNPVNTALSATDQLLDQQELQLSDVAQSLGALGLAVAKAVETFSSLPTPAGTPSDAVTNLAKDLLGFLLANQIITAFPRVAALGKLTGFLTSVAVPQVTSQSGQVLRASSRHEVVNFSAIGGALHDPLGYARSTFLVDPAGNPRAADAIADLVGPDVAAAVIWTGLAASYGIIPPDSGLTLSPAESSAVQRILLIDAPLPAGAGESTLRVAFGLTDDTRPGEGLGLLVVLSGDINLNVPTKYGTLSATFTGALEPLLITGGSVRLASGSAGPVNLAAVVKYVTTSQAGPAFRLGSSGTRLDVTKVELAIKVASNTNVVDIGGTLDITGLALALSGADGDGFLSSIFPAEPIEMRGDVGIDISLRKGVTVRGAGSLDWRMGLGKSIGPIEIVEVQAALRAANGSLEFRLTANLAVTLGPVQISITAIGVASRVVPPAKAGQGRQVGNVGPFELQAGFASPTGLGLLIDAGPIVGGGFVAYDDSKKEYSAVIQLLLLEVQISAIAILDTVLPDGSKGYSFILILTLQSDEGIPLGFGFTLNGVGGLAGINRTMVLDAIQASVRSHSLDSILFPTDPVAHAPQIISQISTIFPPSVGVYVFGPMLKLGWGDPTVITVSLGLILELPAPLRIALLGIVTVTLPDPYVPVVALHMDVDGTLDFGLKALAIDATIYDSRLVQYSLSGDMAFRFNWGGKLIWTLSIGGFNPQFEPPAGFPSLKRMIVSIGIGDNPSLSLHAYIARTSNTVQFGADFELRASEGGFDVHGYLAFDVLVHFPGWTFVADMTAGVDIRWKGLSLANIALDLQLQGQPPLVYTGTATFHAFGFSKSKTFHNQIGDAAAGAGAVSQAVMVLLMKDVSRRANWSADLPDDAEPVVSLLKPAVGDSAILVHPMGKLRIHQKVVPLKTPISKFGNATPTDGDQFEITQIMVGSTDSTASGIDATDMFAMGQFQDMTDAQLLSAQSYQPAPSGLTLDPGGMQTGNVADLDAMFDTWIIEDPVLPSYSGGRYSLQGSVMNPLTKQSAAASSLVWATGNKKFVAPGTTSPISNTQTTYVVTSTEDLSVRYDITGGNPATQYMANAQLQAHVQKNPQDRDRLQVMPQHEVQA
jgi:hypothetical protein